MPQRVKTFTARRDIALRGKKLWTHIARAEGHGDQKEWAFLNRTRTSDRPRFKKVARPLEFGSGGGWSVGLCPNIVQEIPRRFRRLGLYSRAPGWTPAPGRGLGQPAGGEGRVR